MKLELGRRRMLRRILLSWLAAGCGVGPFEETQARGATEEPYALQLGNWLSFSGHSEGGFRKTQFFAEDHHTGFALWDSRAEIWLPPYREKFSWGPYLRFAGVAATQDEAFENGFLAVPGVGLQVYPFSAGRLRTTNSTLGKCLGPLRLFAEYNRMHFWGSENSWRPDEQYRIGAEYWRARHVNMTSEPWWTEFWTGLFWQSANEFDEHYDSIIFANALRAGIRKPAPGFLSLFTPYVALESSLTSNPDYYWENRLLLGGGMRIAPSREILPEGLRWINRFVVFAEYLHAVAYYRESAPSSVPDYDLRIGISISVGEWYR